MSEYQVKLDVPPGARSVLCRGPNCQAPIFWVRTQRGRNVPVNTDGTHHRDTCPDRDLFRQKQALKADELRELLEHAMQDIQTFGRHEAAFLQSSFVRIRMGERIQDWENIRVQRIIKSNPQIEHEA